MAHPLQRFRARLSVQNLGHCEGDPGVRVARVHLHRLPREAACVGRGARGEATCPAVHAHASVSGEEAGAATHAAIPAASPASARN